MATAVMQLPLGSWLTPERWAKVAPVLLGEVDGPSGMKAAAAAGGVSVAEVRRKVAGDPLDPPVVRPEIVSPIRDAVGFVNDQQADAFGNLRQHLGTEAFVAEPLGRNQQNIRLVALQRFFSDLPVILIVGSNTDCVNPHPLRGRDLVPHQRKQWGDEKRGTLSGFTQEFGRNEVHNALAPTGFLNNEKATASFYETANSLFLALPERGIGSAGAGLQ